MDRRFSNFIIYKPYGMLSQFTPEGNKPALGELYAFPKNCYPVGRLDSDSEGLLLITNDTSLNKKVLDPVVAHPRTYYVQVDGAVTDEALQQLSDGVEIRVEGKNYHTHRAKAERIEEPGLPPRNPPVRFRKTIPTSWIALTLTEGKNRQVRHMTAAVGFPTLRLVRVKIAGVELNGMQPGEVRPIDSAELYLKLFGQ